MSKEEKELQEQISNVANKQLRREQLLEQRIKNLEAKIEAKEINSRIKSLEYFRDFVLVLSAVVVIFKMFV